MTVRNWTEKKKKYENMGDEIDAQSKRADRAVCAKTPSDSKEKKKDGLMEPKIRSRRGRECEGRRDRA